MSDSLKKLNKIYFEGNQNIVIQDVENTTITINKNNTEELEAFFINYSDRLNEFESILVKSQNDFANLNKSLSNFFKVKRSVYVVGSGNYNLDELEYKYAKIIGIELANLNYNLIGGGWQGVDYVVADEYAKVLDKKNQRLSDKLTQIVSTNKQPEYKGGNIEYVREGISEWLECLEKANILLMIGGKGGTYETFLHAKKEKIPVVPLAFTGGDAQRAYQEILSNLEAFPVVKDNIELFKKFEKESPTFTEALKTLLEITFKSL